MGRFTVFSNNIIIISKLPDHLPPPNNLYEASDEVAMVIAVTAEVIGMRMTRPFDVSKSGSELTGSSRNRLESKLKANVEAWPGGAFICRPEALRFMIEKSGYR